MMATGNARGGTPIANEISEASAGFLVGTGEGAQVLLGGLARKCTVGRSSTPDQRRRAESVDMSGCARRWKTEVSQHRFGRETVDSCFRRGFPDLEVMGA
jgi:hypothetical protein